VEVRGGHGGGAKSVEVPRLNLDFLSAVERTERNVVYKLLDSNTTVVLIQAGSRGVAVPYGFDADIFERLVTHADAAVGSYFANRVIPTERSAYSKQSRQTS
jgi:hypothetical protein